MGIANELTSDVAAALLEYKNDEVPFASETVPEIIRKFHVALRDLSTKERSRRVFRESPDDESAANQAASGGH